MTFKTLGYAAQDKDSPLALFRFERRELLPHDVHIEILFCGVCHSDLHIVKNEWKNTIYPVVPGHEIVGRVIKIGNAVTHFKIGDLAAVGCMINSCRTCLNCKAHLEQYCESGMTLTYNSIEKATGKVAYGGYSKNIIVDEQFVLHIPQEFKETDLAGVAPLLCAGITTYSPLKHWKISKDSKVGIVGLGGLGHMGIKIAKAMGASVTLFTTSSHKIADGKKLGADEVILSNDVKMMESKINTFDFLLDTIAAPHDLNVYVNLLKRDGTLCLVGLPDRLPPPIEISNLIHKRRKIAGSVIGGIQETQEMLDFCAVHHLLAEIELIPIQKINEAYVRMVKSDVKYRFVIDMASLKF